MSTPRLDIAAALANLPAFPRLQGKRVCLRAPDLLWWSGVGVLIAKVTATADWKLAFHARGTYVNDFAALLSDATVFQFIARPEHDPEGVRLLGTALMLNGISMEIAGSSRPVSGSEHLISHALDQIAQRPRLHGLQVGVATYIVSHLQRQGTERITRVLDATGFWQAIAADPFSTEEWLAAVRLAPSMKENYYTVLSSRDCVPEVLVGAEVDDVGRHRHEQRGSQPTPQRTHSLLAQHPERDTLASHHRLRS
jgi:glycerol-1-phosphate dehydrogenase [NAD(P)+]